MSFVSRNLIGNIISLLQLLKNKACKISGFFRKSIKVFSRGICKAKIYLIKGWKGPGKSPGS